MDLLIVIAVWLGSGAVGSVLEIEFFWRRGSVPMDVDVEDLIFFGFLALLGPINLAVGILCFMLWVLRRIWSATGLDASRVVFEARP